jgi:4-amino-4-deoxy-L-arabinose transferase-like glycosyltransferase
MTLTAGQHGRLGERPDIAWGGLFLIAIASFAACALVDLFYFGPTTISGDEDRLMRSAAHLLATGEFRVGIDRAWEMPGTALFFAPLLYLFPASPLTAIRLTQGVLVAVQSVCIGVLATMIFKDRRAGIIAALMAGFYPYLIFTQGLALSETLFNALLVAGFLCLYAWRMRGARIDGLMALTIAMLVLATLTKATLTILPPLLVAAGAVGVHSAGGILRILIVATTIYCVLMSPWWLRNYLLLHTFVPFTTSASQNLYMGNSPNNPNVATYAPYLPVDWSVDQGRDLASIQNELERSRAYRDAAFAYIAQDPLGFVRRAWIKAVTFWNVFPNAPAYQSPVYRIGGLLSFGPVLLFALICLFQHRAQFVRLLPFYLIAGYFTALYLITIASIRYRLPLEPLMIVLAAAPIARITRSLIPARAIQLEAARTP